MEAWGVIGSFVIVNDTFQPAQPIQPISKKWGIEVSKTHNHFSNTYYNFGVSLLYNYKIGADLVQILVLTPSLRGK